MDTFEALNHDLAGVSTLSLNEAVGDRLNAFKSKIILSKSFVLAAEKLKAKASSLSSKDETLKALDFAKEFNETYEAACKEDRGKMGPHHDHLNASLQDKIGTENKSIRSRWITIGKHALKLKTFSSSIPSYRDALYEIALAIEKDRPIAKWIEKGKLTQNTSIREIQYLRSAAKKKKIPSTANITLRFDTFDNAAAALLPLLQANLSVTYKGEKAFTQALKSMLGERDWKVFAMKRGLS